MRRLVFGLASFVAMSLLPASSFAADPPPPAEVPPPPPVVEGAPASAPPQDQPDAPDTSVKTMHGALSAFGAVGYSYGFAAGFGAGVRFQWILVPKGFLRRLPKRMHDEFGIEPGFDFFHAGYSVSEPGFSASWDYNEYTPLVGALWNIWLTENFAVYPKIDIGYRIASWSETVNGGSSTTSVAHADLFPLYFQGAAGIDYRIGPVALRAEVGWQAVRAGVGVNLF